MKTIRLDDYLATRVERAAALEGITTSEFIRRSAAERAERTLPKTAREAFADVIGIVKSGRGDLARRSNDVFDEIVTEKHTRRVAR